MSPANPSQTEPIDAVYTYRNEIRLRFSLRSLERYAPWVRKVHLAIDGPAPAWLASSHPRLAVAPIGNPWQIFRIPGLSRQFLYLEDNFFLGKPLTPADFLTAKGGYRIFVESGELPAGTPAQNLLNGRFGSRSPRKKPARMPSLLDKSFLEEVHRIWEVPIKRQPHDLSLETLYFYYLLECPLQHGIHETSVVDSNAMTLASPADARKKMARLLLHKPRFFCLEMDENDSKTAVSMQKFLRLCYLRKSPFEAD